jgi:hypothetical protein
LLLRTQITRFFSNEFQLFFSPVVSVLRIIRKQPVSIEEGFGSLKKKTLTGGGATLWVSTSNLVAGNPHVETRWVRALNGAWSISK